MRGDGQSYPARVITTMPNMRQARTILRSEVKLLKYLSSIQKEQQKKPEIMTLQTGSTKAAV